MMHGWLPSLIPGPGTSACMGRILSRWCRKFPIHFSSLSFFVRPGSPFLRPDPHIRIAGARKKRSRMGALAPTEGSSLRASSTTAHLSMSAMTTSEGSCGLVHEASCHILVCGGPKTQTMMQGYASAASSEAKPPSARNRIWALPLAPFTVIEPPCSRTSVEHDVVAEPAVLLPRVASAERLGENVLKTRDGRVVIADALARKALDGTLQDKLARERIRSAPHPWCGKELKRFNPSLDQLAVKLLRRRVERPQAFDG